MRLVVIESPFSTADRLQLSSQHFPGGAEDHVAYARRALADSIARGEAPFASHLLYTQQGVLRDDIPAERTKGILCGLEWGSKADLVAVYQDWGVTEGMKRGIRNALEHKIPVEYRVIGR